MYHDRGESRGGHPVDPCRLPQCLGLRFRQPLDHLARQPTDRRIVERRIERDRLVRCQRAQLGILPRNIGRVMRVLDDLRQDRRIDRFELGRKRCKPRDRYLRIAEQVDPPPRNPVARKRQPDCDIVGDARHDRNAR